VQQRSVCCLINEYDDNDDDEPRLIMLYFTELDRFVGLLRFTSQWLKIDIVSRISSSTFGHNWPTLQRGSLRPI